MNIFAFPLKNFSPLIFLALFTLTACGGGGGGGGGGSSSASGGGTTEPPPEPEGDTVEYTQTSSRVMNTEKPDLCAAWTEGKHLKLIPHADRRGTATNPVTEDIIFYKEQRDEFCGDELVGGTDGGSDGILPPGFGDDASDIVNKNFSVVAGNICYMVAAAGGSAALFPDNNKLYRVNLGTFNTKKVALTRVQILAICGGEVPDGFDVDYLTKYVNIDEMYAVNLPSDMTRTQPQIEILRQSSISLSHLFQRGAMQDNVINTHDEFGNTISFSPLQAQSVKSSYGLSDAMHDLTFSATEEEVFSNEQARLAFTTNKYDSAQSNFNADYHLGNMFISADYNPLMKGTKESTMQFMQISDSARDVGTLGVSHKLGDRITFTQKAGAGTLNTGNRFDEISTALAYHQGSKKLAVTTGRLREYDQFLGSVTTGAYALDEATESAFVSLHADMSLGKNLTMQANYSAMNSAVSLHHDDFVRVTSLRSDSYDFKLQSKMKRGNLSLQYLVPLAVTDGTWQQRNVVNLQDSISRQDLSVNQRHQQWNLRYQSNTNVFATLTRDENYSNIAGLNETRVMTGLSKRF